MLQIDSIAIERLAACDYELSWNTSRPETSVGVALVTEHLENMESELVVETTDNKVFIQGLQPDRRHLFHLSDGSGNETVVAHRHIPMKGTPNFRDFGGYQTKDGRRVKWGYLFRSGQLAKLNDMDMSLLEDLKLNLICDFRQVSEQDNDPTRLPESASTKITSLSITPGSFGNSFEGVTNVKDMFDFMVVVNRGFALEQRAQYSAMFDQMLNADQGRTLVHCTAGKDRTGFAAAIILLALGVSREAVMADYLLTAEFFRSGIGFERIAKKYALDLNPEAIRPMLEVHPEYLQEALDAIDENFESLGSYLDQHLGLNQSRREELKSMYLL